MQTEEIIEKANQLARECDTFREVELADPFAPHHAGCLAAAKSFLQRFAGARSPFYKDSCNMGDTDGMASILQSFAVSLERGLIEGRDPKREAQVEVVSDILGQAQTLLADKKVHPAAPAVLIGAGLEEFLRTWIEREGITATGKPGLSSYSTALAKAGHLTKQDTKNITSWAGLRNHAAHGEWDDVPKGAVQIMLQGVNLFLQIYQHA